MKKKQEITDKSKNLKRNRGDHEIHGLRHQEFVFSRLTYESDSVFI